MTGITIRKKHHNSKEDRSYFIQCTNRNRRASERAGKNEQGFCFSLFLSVLLRCNLHYTNVTNLKWLDEFQQRNIHLCNCHHDQEDIEHVPHPQEFLSSPDWHGSEHWMTSLKAHGHRLDSWSGNRSGLWLRPRLGHVWAATDWCFFPSISPSLPLSLK